jgi:phosphatidylinositol glycan class C protein
MFTAVLLASRLKDISTVVSFVLLAVICFALFPEVAKLIRRRSTALHLVLTVVQYVIASMLLIRFDWTLFIVYQLLIVIVWLICPIWLWQMQRFKRSLRGPWEEAKVM